MTMGAHPKNSDLVFEAGEEILARLEHDIWSEVKAVHSPNPPVSFVDWCPRVILTPTQSERPGPVRLNGMQRGLATFMADLRIKRFIFMKPSQIGYSLLLALFIWYELEHRKRTFGVYSQDQDAAKIFYKKQILPILEGNPWLREILKCGPENWDRKSPDNQTDYVNCIGCELFNRYGTVESQYRVIPIQSGANEELDAMPFSVEGKGSPDGLLRERTNAATRPKELNGSTPLMAGASNIERLFNKSEHKFYFQCECPRCKKPSALDWGGEDADVGMVYDGIYKDDGTIDISASAATARHVCRHCREPSYYHELRHMNRNGYWQSDQYTLSNLLNFHYTEDFQNNQDPEIVDPPIEAACHITQVNSETVSWQEGARRKLEADLLYRNTQDNSDLIIHRNNYQAKTFASVKIADNVPWETLFKSRENYGFECPPHAQYITCWCDVQKDRIEFETVAHCAKGESYVLEYRIIPGSCRHSNVLDKYGEYVANRQFKKSTGQYVRINQAGIDSGKWTNTIYHFVLEYNARYGSEKIMATKGDGKVGRQISEYRQQDNEEFDGLFILLIGTEQTKDIVYQRYLPETANDAVYHMPISKDTGEKYCKGKVAETKQTKFVGGQLIEKWDHIQKGVIDNEPFDTAVGNVALLDIATQFGFVMDNELSFKKATELYESRTGSVTEPIQNKTITPPKPTPEQPIPQVSAGGVRTGIDPAKIAAQFKGKK